MSERKYFNHLHGMNGFEGSDYPKYMTREELISMTVDSLKGTSNGIEEGFNDYFHYMKEHDCEIDFEYEDLTIEELSGLVDSEIFICETCGWIYSNGEMDFGGKNRDENICQNCADNYDEEGDEE